MLAQRALSSLVSYEYEHRLATAAKSKRRSSFHNDDEATTQAFHSGANSLSTVWSLAYPLVNSAENISRGESMYRWAETMAPATIEASSIARNSSVIGSNAVTGSLAH